jgi:hypothetical protein
MSKDDNLYEGLERKVSEEEYAKIIQPEIDHLLKISNFALDKKITDLQLPFYLHVKQESDQLERLLDDSEVSDNENWIYMRELAATLRWMSSTISEVHHISSRLKKYNLNPETTKDFVEDTKEISIFLGDTIYKALKELKNEAARLKIKVDSEKIGHDEFTYVTPQVKLISTRSARKEKDEPKIISDIVRDYLAVSNNILKYDLKEKKSNTEVDLILKKRKEYKQPPHDINEKDIFHLGTALKKDILSHITFSDTEKIRSWLNNIEDDYDTFIKQSEYPDKTPELKKVRGKIGVSLHLMEIAKNLTHFYQRHEMESEDRETKQKIQKIVDKEKLANTIVNYAYHYATRYLEGGNRTVKDLEKIYKQYRFDNLTGISTYLNDIDPSESIKFVSQGKVYDRGNSAIIDAIASSCEKFDIKIERAKILDPNRLIPESRKKDIPYEILHEINLS